jgi:hypothetical protein
VIKSLPLSTRQLPPTCDVFFPAITLNRREHIVTPGAITLSRMHFVTCAGPELRGRDLLKSQCPGILRVVVPGRVETVATPSTL